MKYEITYSCGHMGTVELFGSNKERERRMANIEKYHVCPDCENAATKKQLESDKSASLPELEGTEKQIAWAVDLRQQFIKACKENNMPEYVKPVYDYILANVTDSRVWIDNRSNLLWLIRIYKDEVK
ncbi:MAG: hypothetical protein U0I48_01370 [Acutalibacteraceae bacterium]|nr:hypothetical protein [Acutalibacteraceae bacterium]